MESQSAMSERSSEGDQTAGRASRVELNAEDFDYYVALDLGSESMAACFQYREEREPTDIDLQRLADWLLPTGQGQIGAELLREENESARSSRLRTRISLEGGRQSSPPLPPDHARLELEENDHTTLFGFFHPEGSALGTKLLPNPKLLFQTGIRNIIPEVRTREGDTATFRAGELLEHLIGQILINFVLNSPQLRDDAKSRGITFEKRRVLLFLTIPNVYSQGHASKLERFIQAEIPIGAVRVIYESDAIAHYMMGRLLDKIDPPAISSLKQNIRASLRSAADRTDPRPEGCLLLTIDIGKGTTDLSLFNYYLARHDGGNVLSHEISARTGRSHGGVRLSYLLAAHFDARIGRVVDAYAKRGGRLAKAIADVRPQIGILAQPGWPSGRARLLGAAEKLVETIKRHVDANYRITLTAAEQRPLARALAQAVRAEIEQATPINRPAKTEAEVPASAGAPTAAQEPQSTKSPFDRLEQDLEDVLLLPKHLPREEFAIRFPRWLARLVGRPMAPVDERAPFVKLRRDLEDYVRANVDEPLEWLNEMAAAREDDGKTPLGSGIPTFVVVAGQASQFGPIQQAIEMWAKERLGISSAEGDLVFLHGKFAKFACCYGAQWVFRNAIQTTNPDAILGSYAFLGVGGLIPLPMRTFEARQIVEKQLNAGEYWLIFQPRHLDPNHQATEEEITALLRSGSVAHIRTLRKTDPWIVQLRYKGPEAGFQYRPKKKEEEKEQAKEKETERAKEEDEETWIDLAPEANFGDIDENIYLKTWPEAVPNAK